MPPPADAGKQDATGVGPVVTLLQLVAVQALPEPAAMVEHEDTGVSAVVTVLQVVVV